MNDALSHVIRIEKQREYGLLNQRPSRNPIMAEKTPRINYRGFEFKPPEPKPEPERWHYPESDWGLMAKFSTQKPIYDKIFQKERDHAKMVEEFTEIRKKNEQAIQEELQKQRQKFEESHLEITTSDRDLDYHTGRTPKFQNSSFPNYDGDTYKDELHMDQEKKKSQEAKYKKQSNHFLATKGLDIDEKVDIDHLPKKLNALQISKIKTVGDAHPEILEKWRAERAAAFIATQKDPTQPPQMRTIGERAFKPAGSINRSTKNSTTGTQKRRVSSRDETMNSSDVTGALSDVNVAHLLQELEKTEDELARQQLKVALKSTSRKYGKGKSVRRGNSSIF